MTNAFEPDWDAIDAAAYANVIGDIDYCETPDLRAAIVAYELQRKDAGYRWCKVTREQGTPLIVASDFE